MKSPTSPEVASPREMGREKFRVIFMGTGEIGLPVLEMLIGNPLCDVVAVVTQPDRPAGRSHEMRAPEIKVAAERAGLAVLQPEKLRAPDAISELEKLDPDLIVVMAYGQILSRRVLDLPRIACLNLHASLLPRWRGASPIQAAIAAGDQSTGITVMYMAEGLDTGDILLEHEIPITASETAGSLHDRLADVAPVALHQAIQMLVAGNAPRIVQDEAKVTTTRKLLRDDGLTEWSRSAVDLERFVRAMNPWPGAWFLHGEPGKERRIKVFRAQVAEDTGKATAEVPGMLMGLTNDGVAVTTGAGRLLLLEVQAEGKKRMSATEWWRGRSVDVGKST